MCTGEIVTSHWLLGLNSLSFDDVWLRPRLLHVEMFRLPRLDVLVGVEIPLWQGDRNGRDLGHGQHATRSGRLRGAHLLWMESVIATELFSPLASIWMMFGGVRQVLQTARKRSYIRGSCSEAPSASADNVSPQIATSESCGHIAEVSGDSSTS